MMVVVKAFHCRLVAMVTYPLVAISTLAMAFDQPLVVVVNHIAWVITYPFMVAAFPLAIIHILVKVIASLVVSHIQVMFT